MGTPASIDRDWYETPLFYDMVFDEDTVAEADFLEEIHLRHGRGRRHHPRRVIEPACGSGRLIAEFAERGWKVSGFDASVPMLEFAHQRSSASTSTIDLWQDRMEDFTLRSRQSFDLAHCLVSTFKYLHTEAAALAFLQRIAACLKPGGLFVLGLHLTDYADQKIHHERWVARRDGIEVVCNTRTWPPDRKQRLEALRTRLRILDSDGGKRLQETRWQFRTYSAAQLRSLLRKVREWEVVACHDFRYDLQEERELDDSYADLIVVLRRR